MDLALDEEPPSPPAPPHILIAFTTPCEALEDALARRQEADQLADTANYVAAVFAKNGFRTSQIAVQDDVRSVIDFCARNDVDVVFNLVDAVAGDDRREPDLPEALDHLGIPYTGCSAHALRTALRKDLLLERLRERGVAVARSVIVAPGEKVGRISVRRPWFVKPAGCDGSIGIDQGSVINDVASLRRRVDDLHRSFQCPVLVEEYLPGPELNVAMLPTSGWSAVTLMDFGSHPEGCWPIVTYACKWIESSPEYVGGSVPAAGRVSDATLEEAHRLALEALRTLEATGPGRVDLRQDRDGRLVVMDVNPNPDLAPDAGFMRAMSFSGSSFDEVVHAIATPALGQGVRRHAGPRWLDAR